MNNPSRAAEQSSIRIREFLLHGPAQQRSGKHRGAVAGTLAADGSAHYFYGEITGYYLHWLASLPLASSALNSSAQTAILWLQNYLRGPNLPLTRVYGHAPVEDWRNEALFAFDLAMIAGGLARAGKARLASLPSPLLADLQRWLLLFAGEHGLQVFIARSPTAALPQRWSTSGGSFTAKTASRILLLGAETTLDAALMRACRAELQTALAKAEQQPIGMLHPALYALEGALPGANTDLDKVARLFERLIVLQAADGSLPESLESPTVRRTDIIAQALRMAILLERLLAQPGRYRAVCDDLAQALLRRIREDGSVAFSTDGKPEANVWGAMFAEQALRLYAAYAKELPLPFGADALV